MISKPLANFHYVRSNSGNQMRASTIKTLITKIFIIAFSAAVGASGSTSATYGSRSLPQCLQIFASNFTISAQDGHLRFPLSKACFSKPSIFGEIPNEWIKATGKIKKPYRPHRAKSRPLFLAMSAGIQAKTAAVSSKTININLNTFLRHS